MRSVANVVTMLTGGLSIGFLLVVWDHVASKLNVGVVGGEADVLGEVLELVLAVGQVSRVVDWDNDGLDSIGQSGGLHVVGVDVLGVLDDPRVEVVPWEDLVWGWQDDALGVWTQEDGGGEGLDELLLVDVNAGPCGGLQECSVVLGA